MSIRTWPLQQGRRGALGFSPLLVLLAPAACSDGATIIVQTPEANQPAPDGSNGASGAEASLQPQLALYAIATVVSGPKESNMYLRVLDSLEPQEDLDLSSAREFPGWSDVKVSGGKLFVSSGEGPTVMRFGVNERRELIEEGRISFGAYAADASMYTQAFISETKAYLAVGANEYVVWNPSTLTITGTITGPEIAPVGAAEAAPAQDRGMVVRGQRLYHSINWFDYENYAMPASSRVVVIDTDADTIIDSIDAPCPYLEPGTVDEGGNIYFSNWVYSPAATLVNDQARACAVRIPAGSDSLDPDFQLAFADVTDGHEAAAMEYLGGGKALLSVFHEENQAFDRAVDHPSDWLFGANWRFAMLDLETRESREIDALGWHSGGYYANEIQGQDYILVPGPNYESTQLYRLSEAGDVTRILGTSGWSIRLIELR
jgi:hypothetical protein